MLVGYRSENLLDAFGYEYWAFRLHAQMGTFGHWCILAGFPLLGRAIGIRRSAQKMEVEGPG